MRNLLLTFFVLTITIAQAFAEELPNLSRQDETVKAIRLDIKQSLRTVKSKRKAELLPELKFYKYRVQAGDTFWNILARSSLNMDTILTVNNLDSPNDVTPGSELYLPNMRGVVHQVQSGDTIDSIESKYRISREYILEVNRIDSLSKAFIFVPCGELTRDERTAFMGTSFLKPLEKMVITSGYGNRVDPFLKTPAFHSGIDIKCSTGTQVKATKSGKVSFVGQMSNYGKLVIISHSDGYLSYYGHLSRFNVVKGQTVKAGDVIALSGNSGRSTGPHLHFEIRRNGKPLNPLKKIK